MKKKINLNIYKSGSTVLFICQAIANYNESGGDFSPRDLEGYLKLRAPAYPHSEGDFKLIKGEEPNCYHISEDGGKTFTLSLEWAEVHELQVVTDSEGSIGAGC